MLKTVAMILSVATCLIALPSFASGSDCAESLRIESQIEELSDLSSFSDNCVRNFDEGGECTPAERAGILDREAKVSELRLRLTAAQDNCSSNN